MLDRVCLHVVILARGGLLSGEGGRVDHCVAQRGDIVRAGVDLDDKLALGRAACLHIGNVLDDDRVRFACRHARCLGHCGTELVESAGDGTVQRHPGQRLDEDGRALGLHGSHRRLGQATFDGGARILIVDDWRAELARLRVGDNRSDRSHWVNLLPGISF